MTRKFLWGLIICLLITNLTTLAIWMNEKKITSPVEPLNGNVDEKRSVATVNGREISYNTWVSKLQEQYGEKVLRDMMDKQIVFQLAEDQGIEISQNLINREVSLLFTMYGVLSSEEIKENEAAWEEDVRYRLSLEELLTADISIDNSEIMDYYEDNRQQYEFDESIQVSHIVVNDLETGNKVYEELEDGASFQALAREYTIDENSRSDGGYLGFFTENNDYLPARYYEKAMEMKEDSYSEPFRTASGEVAILYFHRLLPSITFSYDEIKYHIKRELALEQIKPTITTDPFWDEMDVEWIYE
ncbi:peptidylprolyl isomerase [Aquibacillus salsiterrae]|uniref:peptidylprolyl isomerase n=1 Tax=Aquibacillus salsiterrae TaxID=2950439 RepID=A0A9X4AFQ6_9BACI|nr:peptidylprolyl isomerase [Aquibacillus salsiterrae]MDC3417909.1 peptidylprolyl isomerase [Aquibacillus salsiterrae]